MTMTAPAWLDVDSIVDPAIQSRLRDLASRVAHLYQGLDELRAESIAAVDAFQGGVDGAGAGDLLDRLGPLTGYDELVEAWLTIGEFAAAITE